MSKIYVVVCLFIDCNHFINNGNEDNYLNIIPIICVADIFEDFHLPTLRRFFDEVFDGGKKKRLQKCPEA